MTDTTGPHPATSPAVPAPGAAAEGDARAVSARSDVEGGPSPASARPLLAVAAWWCWASGVASFFLFVVYPRFHSPWGLAGLQTAAYAVLVAPVVVLRPTLHADGRPQRRRLWNASGAVVLAAAVVITAASGLSAAAVARDVTKYLATGVVEEVLFRGVLWCLLARRIARPALLVAADVALFVAWHVPSVLAGDSSGQGLWVVGALGVVFALARLASGRIGLPALLHVAVDLLGSS